jgi:hypothetical protein
VKLASGRYLLAADVNGAANESGHVYLEQREAEPAALEIPEVIFEHRAVLYANGQPFSEVHELYRRQLLFFPWPHP